MYRSIAFASLFTLASASVAEDWPFFRGPNRNGIADVEFEPVDDEPKRLWKVNIGDSDRRGSSVIAAGRLYIGGGEKGTFYVHCLDAVTGRTLWKHPTYQSHSTPAVHKGRVYALGDNRVVYCMDADTGASVWQSRALPEPPGNPHYGHQGSPLIWEDLVIVNAGNGCALSQETGEVMWKSEGFPGLATPVLFTYRRKPAVAIFAGDRLVARDARSGEMHWTIPWETNLHVNACDPIFVDNDSKVFLCTRYDKGIALYDVSSSDPKELWYYQDQAHTYATGVYYQNRLYACAAGLAELDLETGKILWAGQYADSITILGQGYVQVSSQGELMMGKITENGFVETNRAQIHTGETMNVPAYWKGKLYLRNHKGELVCVQISK